MLKMKMFLSFACDLFMFTILEKCEHNKLTRGLKAILINSPYTVVNFSSSESVLLRDQ